MSGERLCIKVEEEEAGERVDVFLARRKAGLTRSQAERLAKRDKVWVNGRPAPAGNKVEEGDLVEVELPEGEAVEPQPEQVKLDILYEDEQLLVVNKPRGMAVHPGVGRQRETLVNALLGHCSQLATGSGPHRPGIVHRLDMDTTGLLVVAKTDEVFVSLQEQLKKREIERRYLALVWGIIREDHVIIDAPIGRHEKQPMKMMVVSQLEGSGRARSARTEVWVLERCQTMTLVEARLDTGRMHQIRVHLAHLGHPVVGDKVYGRKRAREFLLGLEGEERKAVEALEGQALHAHLLRFRNPSGGQEVTFNAPLPEDFARVLEQAGKGAG